MNYVYTIGHIAEDSRWIYIDYEDAMNDSEGFVELVKKFATIVMGKWLKLVTYDMKS